MSMCYNMEDDSEISDSEIHVYLEIYYLQLKEGKLKIWSENIYKCPFCVGKSKQEYQYLDLLQHATEIGASNMKADVNAKHQALEKYLKRDLSETTSSTLQSMVSKKESPKLKQEDRFVWPWMGILVNVPNEENSNSVGISKPRMEDQLSRFNPLRVHQILDHSGHTGNVILEFNKDWTGFRNALDFENHFYVEHSGKKEWTNKEHYVYKIYGWVARAEDFNSPGYVGEHLKKHGVLRTVTDIQNDVSREHDFHVTSLIHQIQDQKHQMEEVKFQNRGSILLLNKIVEQHDALVKNHKMEILKMQQRFELATKRNELDETNRQLNQLSEQNVMNKKCLMEEKQKNATKNNSLELAEMAKNEADKDMLKLIEEQRIEKENDQEVDNELPNRKIEEMNAERKEKIEDMKDLKDLYNTLKLKERKSNAELQDARNELISALNNRLSRLSNISIKRLGDLDHKPFIKFCKERFPENAEMEVVKFCYKWETELPNPNWRPFQIILVDGEEKEVLGQDDEKLQSLKTELGDEVYRAVTRALLERNEFDPIGRSVVSELWNTKEGRKATMKEVIQYILRQWNKRKREV